MKFFLKKSVVLLNLLPAVSMAQGTGDAIDTIIGALGDTLNDFIIPALFVLATLVFIWGVITYIAQADDEGARKKAKQLMLWGIIGLAVITAVWTIVSVIITYFGVGGAAIPQVPGTDIPGQ